MKNSSTRSSISSDNCASIYPIAIFFIIIFSSGLVIYLLSDIVNTFIYFSSANQTFYSVFWKAIIILIPFLSGIWMIIYMQRLRRDENG